MFKHMPILMYHTIEPEGSSKIVAEENFYNVTPERFAAQMEHLKDSGYTAITSKQLISFKEDSELPGKPVMLTFDDGHISHYKTALPILKKAGLGGIFFVVTNDIGAPNRMTWDEIKMLKKEGMDIGSHGANHDLMNKIPDPVLIAELQASKSELEENLGGSIDAFSIPRGFYSSKISDFARGIGYKLVFTSFTGNATLSSNPFRLRRTVMLKNYSMKDFIDIVTKNPVFLAKKQLLQLAKGVLQKSIGIRRYDWVKKQVFAKA